MCHALPVFSFQVAIDQDTRSEEELQSLTILTYIPSLILNYSKGSIWSLLFAAFGNNVWYIFKKKYKLTANDSRQSYVIILFF